MSASRRLLSALSLLLPALLPASPAAGAGDDPDRKRPQLVIVSFDGAHDNRLWERSLAMGQKTGAHFTYFLSCTFLMSKAEAKSYRAPGQAAGRSNVGFAPDHADVAARLGHIWAARQAGHEIASHACGHFDGKNWSKADWAEEFTRFDSALADAWEVIGQKDAEPEGWQEFAKSGIAGFRAPYLSTGPGLYQALAAHGFAYDASGVSRGPAWPETGGTLARFALPTIPEGPRGRRVIAMDYNLFVRHSGGEETPARSEEFRKRALAAFRAAFERQYSGKRIPLQMGFHFVEMNGGAYWNALDDFLTETCGKPDVDCVSYGEALARLTDETPAPASPPQGL